MAYTKSRSNGRPALGGITDVFSAAKNIVEDPCLFQVSKMVSHLNDLQQKPPVPGAPPPPTVKGIGLCTAVTPLRVVTYVAERPWVLPVAGVGIVVGLISLGYLLGKPAR